MPLHSSLTGTELHENKGVASASDDTVATATSGATVWKKLGPDNLDTASLFNINKMVLQATLADISTASTVYVSIPFDCTVDYVVSTLGNAITTADATLNFKNAAGSSMGTIVVPYLGSAAGDNNDLAPTLNNIFTSGTRMQIDSDGASDTTAPMYLSIVVTVQS